MKTNTLIGILLVGFLFAFLYFILVGTVALCGIVGGCL